ncbi:hypothetical protein OG21DRAFT_1527900 [Imleria badia]|nr:hypothetical protein OG21DRAFT_1527900 [Imleria badia]
MVFNPDPPQSHLIFSGNQNPSATGSGSHKCCRHKSDERFHLTPSTELHENMIAPVYQRPHANLGQFELCNSFQTNGYSELRAELEADCYCESLGGPSVVILHVPNFRISTPGSYLGCVVPPPRIPLSSSPHVLAGSHARQKAMYWCGDLASGLAKVTRALRDPLLALLQVLTHKMCQLLQQPFNDSKQFKNHIFKYGAAVIMKASQEDEL